MNLNNRFKQCALIALMATASSSAFAATTGDGQVNFTGSLIATGCTIDINGDTTGPSTPIDVKLGTVPAANLAAIGDTSTPVGFTMGLTNCPAGTAKVVFGGDADTNNANVLKTTGTGSGAAGKVGVQLYDKDHTPLALGTYSASTTLTGTDGAATGKFQFYAGYITTVAAPGAGEASAIANFTISYP